MRKIIGFFILFSLVFSVGAFGQEKLNFQNELSSFFKTDYENKVSRVSPLKLHKLEYNSNHNSVTAYFDIITKVGGSMVGMVPYDSDFYSDRIVKGSVASLDVRGEYFQNFIVCYDNAFFGEATPGGITTYTPTNIHSDKQVDYPMEDYIRIFEIIDFNKKQVSQVIISKQDNRASWAVNFINKFNDIYMFPFSIAFKMKDGSQESYWFFYDKKAKGYFLIERSFISYIMKK